MFLQCQSKPNSTIEYHTVHQKGRPTWRPPTSVPSHINVRFSVSLFLSKTPTSKNRFATHPNCHFLLLLPPACISAIISVPHSDAWRPCFEQTAAVAGLLLFYLFNRLERVPSPQRRQRRRRRLQPTRSATESPPTRRGRGIRRPTKY